MRPLKLVGCLNRRHKAVLFATLLIAGFALIAGSGIGPGLGCVLVGIAFAWAVGSNSRVVHSLFVAVGLALLLTPPAYVWIETQKQEKAMQFVNAAAVSAGSVPIPKDAKPSSDDDTLQVATPDGTVWTIPKKNLPEAQARGARVIQLQGHRVWVQLKNERIGTVPLESLKQAVEMGARPISETATNPQTGERFAWNGEQWVRLDAPSGPGPHWEVVSEEPLNESLWHRISGQLVSPVLRHVIAENWPLEAVGLVLLTIGAGLLISVKLTSAQK